MCRRLLILAVALSLAACGGGGSAVAPSSGAGANAPTGGGSSTSALSVQINMHIPGAASASSAKRRAQFVAASTQGVLVQVYAAPYTSSSPVIGTSATNVSPGSTACGGASGARTCTINIPAPPGADAFVFSTYDQPPNTGTTTFPSGAHILASGTIPSQTISAATANVVNVTLGGVLASTIITPFGYNILAGAGPKSYTLEISALDAAGNVIIGPYLDANGNPDNIVVSEAETGGSGFTTIAVGSATPSTTATLTSSSDIITVSYTGGGSAGYYTTFTATAATGQSLTDTFDPMFVSSTSAAYTGGATPTLNFTSPNQSAVFTVSENAPYGPAVIYPGNCNGIVSFTTPAAGPSETFTVTGSSAGGTCTATIGFNFASETLTINAVGNTNANVAVPGTLLAYLAEGAAGVKIRTADGTLAGSIATSTDASYIAMDDAGNVYTLTNPPGGFYAPTGPGIISLYTPSGAGFPPAYTKSAKTYLPSDPTHLAYIYAAGNGEMVAYEINVAYPYNGGTTDKNIFDIWDPGASGAPSRTITRIDAAPGPGFGWVDHSGNLVVTYNVSCAAGTSTCIQYDIVNASTGAIERTISDTRVLPANQATFIPNYIALGPTGTLYVTESTQQYPDPLAGVYIYPSNGTSEGYAPEPAPEDLDLDATGNIYVLNDSAQTDPTTGLIDPDTAHYLQVLSPDGQTSLRTVQIAPGSAPLAVASDGTTFLAQYTTFGYAGGTFSLLPTQNTPTAIDATGAANIILYDGKTELTSLRRSTLSVGAGSAHAGGFVRRLR